MEKSFAITLEQATAMLSGVSSPKGQEIVVIKTDGDLVWINNQEFFAQSDPEQDYDWVCVQPRGNNIFISTSEDGDDLAEIACEYCQDDEDDDFDGCKEDLFEIFCSSATLDEYGDRVRELREKFNR